MDPLSPSFWFSFFFLSYLLDGGILLLKCSTCHPVLDPSGCTYSAPSPRRLSCSRSGKRVVRLTRQLCHPSLRVREYRPPLCSQMAGRRVPEKLVSWSRPSVAEESSQQRRQGGAAVAAARQPAATEVRRVVIWCSAQASYTSPSYQL